MLPIIPPKRADIGEVIDGLPPNACGSAAPPFWIRNAVEQKQPSKSRRSRSTRSGVSYSGLLGG
ncbi:MAG TPA: hypothetical protein VFS17_02115, partial [Methylophilaceae bacterium]|nr:hypothetical protein [Methylophilaceae bacterium]